MTYVMSLRTNLKQLYQQKFFCFAKLSPLFVFPVLLVLFQTSVRQQHSYLMEFQF